MVVVLTVPHANCPTGEAEGHPCDTAAEDAADLIYGSKNNKNVL